MYSVSSTQTHDMGHKILKLDTFTKQISPDHITCTTIISNKYYYPLPIHFTLKISALLYTFKIGRPKWKDQILQSVIHNIPNEANLRNTI